MAFDLAAVQSALGEAGLSGWLLYDFRGLNPLAVKILDLAAEGHRSRRWFYFIPAAGEPRKLVHQIEQSALDGLPGTKSVYLRWQELESQLAAVLSGADRIAMEYSPRNGNPYVSYVDAGTVELVRSFGVEVVSSGDLVQQFQATLSDDQIASHLEAAKHTFTAFTAVWKFIASEIHARGSVEEAAARDVILGHFQAHGLVTDHSPIVAVGPNAGLPHYETGTGRVTTIKPGDVVLVDLWAKRDEPAGTYSDLTRMGVVGTSPPAEAARAFATIVAARDAAIALVKESFAAGTPLCGWQVDRACRDVVDASGLGEFFCHRTGHSIGAGTHGNGTHMDDLETHDERRILPRTLFSIEPGIYTPTYGVRTETNVLITADGTVQITGGELQTELQRIDVD